MHTRSNEQRDATHSLECDEESKKICVGFEKRFSFKNRSNCKPPNTPQLQEIKCSWALKILEPSNMNSLTSSPDIIVVKTHFLKNHGIFYTRDYLM